MGLFSNILEKLGLKKPVETPVAAPKSGKDFYNPAAPGTRPVTPASKPATGAWSPVAPKVPAPVAITVVDVVAKLEKLSAESTQKLNWKTSIVDLLKLLDIDSSLASRKELAIELGCPADKMDDSAQMNVWLHKKVLEKIAANGGNIPKELLD